MENRTGLHSGSLRDEKMKVGPGDHPTANSGSRPRNLMIAVIAAVALVAVACDSTNSAPVSRARPVSSPNGAASLAARSPYQTEIDPDNFVDAIDNPLFRLEPGTVFRLKGETDGGTEHETITVTERTKNILGVTTTVVRDVVRVEDEIKEFTYDWYAQDRDGNVWYFGEDTAEYENGKVVGKHGSWEAGIDGAQPGIIMNASPQVTDSYRQEYFKGEAEDMFWVTATGGSITVPYGRFDDVVHTLEWSPLEPKIVVEKSYAPGVGLLAERALSGSKEVVELLDVSRP